MVIHRLLSKGDLAFCEEFLTFTILYKDCKFVSLDIASVLDDDVGSWLQMAQTS